ncbi:hypothetical protein C8Q76DRAFT_576854, partial [Earliella scabrosa]
KKKQHLTSIQKTQRKLLRLERKETLDTALSQARAKIWEMAEALHATNPRHTPQYYFRLIMQHTRLKGQQRLPSRWNAFLSMEMEQRNKALPEGTDRKRVSEDDIPKEVSDKWHAMSKEEQAAYTEERYQELLARREGRQAPTPSVPIQTFHDARATVANIQQELIGLNTRTGIEALVFIVKSGPLDFNQPYAFYTNERLADYITLATKNTVPEFAKRLEGYCISGINGLKTSYRQTLLNLKAGAAAIINEKLTLATKGQVTRMQYLNFDEHITAIHLIVIDRWLLSIFCAPGDLSSALELQTLIDSWSNDVTRFRKLSEEEFTEWRRQRLAGGPAPARSAKADEETAPSSGPNPKDATASAASSASTSASASASSSTCETPTDF